ncbi:acetate--CoA ligase family protein [Streptomyces xiaopingdaonensis]|uniref:acetate--CoA ligase family protein n=1 Tax=Streptomyces xiaopingdaonensis TaxID=1565415 RepID=UPI0002E08169|nr:acetate--CoA ligase family protein [Streptomyces xiaopingdaonensis]
MRGDAETGLARLLRPRHLALYGGAAVAEAVRQCRAVGYEGELWPVNPRRQEIEGLPCYRTTDELPEPPDAAFVAVPADRTVGVVAELAARGAGGAVCHASGFAEEGAEGARRTAELRRAAGGMPVIGPNCIGMLNYLDGTALWADRHGGERASSGVALITQSGNIAQNITMQRRALPLAYVVTNGNGAVTGVPQLIDALSADPRVTAIGLHLEGVSDAAEFSRAARSALRRGVPVVALKTGTSELGARAALSHTSSLAGSDVLCDALFARTGVARAHDVPAFVETLKLLHVHGPLEGQGAGEDGRAGITSASCSGGEAALMADTAARHGVELPPLGREQAATMGELLGEHVHISNPLDYHAYIWGDFGAQRACFTALTGADHDMNVLLLDMPRTRASEGDPWATTLDAFTAAREATDSRCCVASSLPEGLPEEESRRLLDAGVAPMQGLSDCLRAIAAARAIGVARSRLRTAEEDGSPLAAPLPPAPRQPSGQGELVDEHAGKSALARYGVAVPHGVAAGREGAAAAAREVGFPVVVKALSPGLAHKSEAGGVRLGLRTENEVTSAVGEMSALADRFLVERMVPGAVAELLVGVHRDPVFGTALTLGAGGVLVEVAADTATLLLPTGREEIEAALSSLRLWPVLRGVRGRPAGDVRAAVAAVEAVAAYAADHDGVAELDVNPLLVLPEGEGAVAADVLVRRQPPYAHGEQGGRTA